MLNVTLLAEGHDCRIGVLGDILITVFHGPGKIEQLKLLETTQDKFVAEKGKVVSLTIISAERLVAPTAELRIESAKLQAKYEHVLICSAVVITTKGFAAVIARTFLAGYQLLVNHKTPHQTFREIPKAVEWIHQVAPQTIGLVGAAFSIEAFAGGMRPPK